MNSTEKLYLPVDGIFQMFDSAAGHRQARVTHPVLQSPGVSNMSKTGLGIIKTVKGRWRQQDKIAVLSRSSSTGHRHVSSDRLPQRSADLLETGVSKPGNCRRVVVLGAANTGKTSIVRRFLGGGFEERYEPTVEDFHRKLFHIRGESYQVELLDAASERDFPAKRRLSILTGDVFLLVFSLTDRGSLRELCGLVAEIRAARAKLAKVKSPTRRIPAVICGNKADAGAHRAVGRSEVTETLGGEIPCYYTSAKDGTGLDDAFRAVASLGGLPEETSPSRHQVVSILAYQSLRRGKRGGGRGRGSGPPCAAVDPLARRPSFTSDLRMVLGSSTKHNKPEKCQIQ